LGQLEENRPGDPTFDTDNILFSAVNPTEVFFRNEPPPGFNPTADNGAEKSSHATSVASVMISTDVSDPNGDGDSPTGVVLGASLFSLGYNSTPPFFDSEIAFSGQQ